MGMYNDPNDALMDRLSKLMQRRDFADPGRLPPGDCKDVTTHLCGLFLKTYAGAILEALKRNR